VVAFAATAAIYRWLAPGASDIVEVELAGSVPRIEQLVGVHRDAYLRALWIDFVFIAGYGAALTAGAWLALRLSFTSTTRRLARAALAATAAAVASDIGENVMLLLLLSAGPPRPEGFAVAAQAFSITKWSLLLPAAVVAIVGVGTTLRRAARGRSSFQLSVTSPSVDDDAPLARGEAGELGVSCAAWRFRSTVPCADPPPEGAAGIGICVSGGGIRSAIFALGALDSLRDVLTQARWLVAVSGGGYAAGAMQLALQRLGEHREAASVARPGDVYHPGSSELDHTRLHGRYLADGAREWLSLAVTVLRGFLVNMLILGLAVVVVARLLAHGYAWLPLDLRMWDSHAWAAKPAVLWAIAVLTGGWLLLSTASVLVESDRQRAARMLRKAAVPALGIAGVVALAGVGLPALAWALHTPRAGAVSLGFSSVSLAAGYLAALIALGKQPSVRAAASRELGKGRGWLRTAGASGRNLLATVGVYLGLLALLAGFVMLFGEVLATTDGFGGVSNWPGRPPEWALTVGLLGVLYLLGLIDQVRWSLHPFYRRRLASAFAVRRVRTGGRVRAEPYDFDAETTDLATYGARPAGFPEVVFCCAAHVSGVLAPPGRRVVPWTMSARYVGGQLHGWVPTDQLQAAVSPTLHSDLTVQAAQAISGAAVASQMGVQQQAYTKFLTLTNIRLGSWLPNPAYLRSDSWARPRLPRRRGLTTLARELAGVFSADSPLIYVTDGGHYENLGLVELLRRRPAVVYCVDASCDHGGVPQTLAAAIQLAHEELGIDVEFPDAAQLGAGPDQPPPTQPTDQLMAQMTARLAPTSVITGTITYPDLGPPYRRATATIVVGKAKLTAETPFPLLAYASNHPTFPSDNTSDQWFDASQFDAYHSLGRDIGAIMLARVPVDSNVDDVDLRKPGDCSQLSSSSGPRLDIAAAALPDSR
jgi:hypothetical protein